MELSGDGAMLILASVQTVLMTIQLRLALIKQSDAFKAKPPGI